MFAALGRLPSRVAYLAAAALTVVSLLAGALPAAADSRPSTDDELWAPDLHSAEPVTGSSIRLKWYDTNTGPTARRVTHFRVTRYVQSEGLYGPGWKTEVIPARKDANGTSTHDVTGLTLGQTYCFVVHAMAPFLNDEAIALDESGASTTRCVRMESPYVRTVPRTCPDCVTATPPLPFETQKRYPGDIIMQPNPGPAAPTKPDLAAVGITGPTTLRQGISQTYGVAITNEGRDVNGTVALNIIFSGALEPGFQTSFLAEAGLYCERSTATAAGTTGVIRCAGGTLKQGQTATVSFPVRAAKTGPGHIVAEVNPSRTLEESDYDDNRTPAFRVEVK